MQWSQQKRGDVMDQLHPMRARMPPGSHISGPLCPSSIEAESHRFGWFIFSREARSHAHTQTRALSLSLSLSLCHTLTHSHTHGLQRDGPGSGYWFLSPSLRFLLTYAPTLSLYLSVACMSVLVHTHTRPPIFSLSQFFSSLLSLFFRLWHL